VAEQQIRKNKALGKWMDDRS